MKKKTLSILLTLTVILALTIALGMTASAGTSDLSIAVDGEDELIFANTAVEAENTYSPYYDGIWASEIITGAMHEVEITLKNPTAQQLQGYRFLVDVTNGTGMQIFANDGQYTYDIVKTGWGPADGFTESTASAMSQKCYINATAGTYTVTLKLVKVGEESTPVTEKSFNVTVYDSLQAAVDAASGATTLKLPDRASEVEGKANSTTIPDGKEITLDLNGSVLKGSGSVITNKGKLTLIDSNSDAEHYFKYKKADAWVYADDAANDSKTAAITISQIGTNTADDTLVKVKGGCITGNGIFNKANLTINGANVVGNTYSTSHGGILNYKGTLNVTSGQILGNKSPKSGGGIINSQGTVTIGTDHTANGSVLIAYNIGSTGAGGVLNYANEDPASLTINKTCTISHNTALQTEYNGNSGGVENYAENTSDPDKAATIIMNGGTISNNEAALSGGGVHNGANCSFEMKGGSITENKAVNRSSDDTGGNGGGVSNFGDFTISAGKISKNQGNLGGGIYSSGKLTISGTAAIKENQAVISEKNPQMHGVIGGVYNDAGTVIMTGGTISDNTAAVKIGGLFNESKSADSKIAKFIMTGGVISGNSAPCVGGVAQFGIMYLGGSAKITGNIEGVSPNEVASNLVVADLQNTSVVLGSGTEIEGVPVPALANDARIGITYANNLNTTNYSFKKGAGIIAAGNSAEQFFSDVADYVVFVKNDNLEVGTLQAAITAAATAETTIKLTNDVTGNITISQGQNITLDLNGNVLKGIGSGSVITNNGTLTVKDSSGQPGTPHYFKVENGLWVWADDTLTEAEKGNATPLRYLNKIPAEGTVIKVPGGAITGGYHSDGRDPVYGGGILNNEGAKLYFESGNVVGNKVEATGSNNAYGGGIGNLRGTVEMTGGSVLGNVAVAKTDNFGRGGAISNNGGTLSISGNSLLSQNTADEGGAIRTSDSTSGAYVYITGGKITYNTAQKGGALIQEYGYTEISDAEITNNKGGGIYLYKYDSCRLKIGGKLIISDNTDYYKTGEALNLYHELNQDTQHQPVINTEKPLLAGSKIGVSSEWVCGPVTKNGSYNDLQYFFSDDPAYGVTFSGSHLSLAKRYDIDSTEDMENALQGTEHNQVWNITKDLTLSKEILTRKNIYIKGNGHTIIGSSRISSECDHMFDFRSASSGNLAYTVILEDLNLVSSEKFRHIAVFQLDAQDTEQHGLDVYLKNTSFDHRVSGSKGGIPVINNSCTVTVLEKFTILTGANSWQAINLDAKDKDAALTFADKAQVQLTDNRSSKSDPLIKLDNYATGQTEYTRTNQTTVSGSYVKNSLMEVRNEQQILLGYDLIPETHRHSSAAAAISVTTSSHGNVTVSPSNAEKGEIVTVSVKADKGYTLETLTVTDRSGKEVKLTTKIAGEKYTFTMPASKVKIEATFMEDNTMLNYFVDVNASDYFYDAALWAAKNNITKGVDNLHFAPYNVTTRAQLITFLWRAAGCPAAAGNASFIDVPAGSYYAQAVAWAIEKGITKGIGDNLFGSNRSITRAEVLAMLWRYAGSPAFANMTADGPAASPYTDVATDAYYYNAVLWAVAEGITTGTGNNTFSPDAPCDRAQIVTFLYRYFTK